jgi:hemerythrin superfamily protein
MKATDLLEKQHRLVEGLFKRFEDADDEDKEALFEDIAKNLVAHDAIEREIFYPACEKAIGEDEDVLGESLVEHGVVEFSLFCADKHRKNSEDLEKYVTVLKELVLHHVKEEESELFPKVKRGMETDELELLGQELQKRFDKALSSDFRRPLKSNLDQVLAGKTKPAKPKTNGSPRSGARSRGRSNSRSGSRSSSRSSSRQASR